MLLDPLENRFLFWLRECNAHFPAVIPARIQPASFSSCGALLFTGIQSDSAVVVHVRSNGNGLKGREGARERPLAKRV